MGQLTTIGFSQQLVNGGSLRKAYVDCGFLRSTISPSEIYLRSDSMCGVYRDKICVLVFPLQINHALCRYIERKNSLLHFTKLSVCVLAQSAVS